MEWKLWKATFSLDGWGEWVITYAAPDDFGKAERLARRFPGPPGGNRPNEQSKPIKLISLVRGTAIGAVWSPKLEEETPEEAALREIEEMFYPYAS